MVHKITYVFLLTSILLSGIASAQTGMNLKRKVAIGRFSNETEYGKSIFYDKNNDPMGKQAADILSARLVQSDKFIMIERQDYDKIVAELNTANQIDQKIGADYLIIGSITQYGRKTVGSNGVFTNRKEQIVEAAVSVRLVDVSTGLIVFSGEGKGDATASDKQIMGIGKTANFDATLSEKAISSAISSLVENIIKTCMDKPWVSYLLSEDNGTYIISGGKSQGIAIGQTFNIVERGKKVKNPQTGIVIELPGKTVAKLTINQLYGNTVQDEVSMGSISDGKVDSKNLDKYYIMEVK